MVRAMSHAHPASIHAPVALVTGASDRIGAAIARALALSGHSVIIHYRSGTAGAQRVRDDICSGGGKAEILKADLSDRTDRADVIARAAALFGPLTTLVNNASIFDPDCARDSSSPATRRCATRPPPTTTTRRSSNRSPTG